MKAKKNDKKNAATRLGINNCIVLSAADCEGLLSLKDLAQIGAFLRAIAAYAYGTSLDFAQAAARCDDRTRELVLTHCLGIWMRKAALRKARRAANSSE